MTDPQAFQVETAHAHLRAYRFTPPVPNGAPSVLLIHGARSRAEDLVGFARQFADDGFETVTYSMGGYGESERKGAFDDSDCRHAEDLEEFTRHLDTEFVLYGTSRGAGIGLMAAALGARAKGVISAGGALDWNGIRETTGDEAMKAWLGGLSTDHLRRNSAANYADRIRIPVRLELGEMEDPEVRRQNHQFANDLRSLGVPVDTVEISRAGHAYFDKRFPQAWESRTVWIKRLASSSP